MNPCCRRLISTALAFFSISVCAGAQPPAIGHGPFFNVLDYGAHNDGSANAARCASRGDCRSEAGWRRHVFSARRPLRLRAH